MEEREKIESVEKPLVMVVDDDKDVADEVGWAIANSKKYEVITVYSAKDALEALKKNNVRCILLDIKMPETDGLTLLQNIRKEYNDSQIKILMMTAYLDVKEEWKKEAEGLVSGYLSKPYKDEEVISVLDKLILADSR